jgi:hypothetical protein
VDRIICPAEECDFAMSRAIEPESAFLIVVQRHEGDSRYRIYLGSPASPNLKLVHICGEDLFDDDLVGTTTEVAAA